MLDGGNDMARIQHSQQLFLLTATVAMEAEGETYKGKLAVAYVIMNRASVYNQTIDQVVLKPFAFSAWNTRGRKHRMQEIPDSAWFEAERAASSAYYQIEEDPSLGATHYLNEPLTRSMRKGGDLPAWVSRLHRLVDIGEHSFYVEAR
ncbi:hypothetical protein LCGC14_2639590, partial [marine sediment metagenome]